MFLYLLVKNRENKKPEHSLAVEADKLCSLTQGKEERKQINLPWSLSKKGSSASGITSSWERKTGLARPERQVLREKEMVGSEQRSSP